MQKTYAHLSVDEVEKYLLSKVFENPDDIKTRKLLVNTFIREIIWYGDKLVITYNFQEEAIPPRLTKSHTEEVEKQVEEATRSASSFSAGSYIFRQTAPKRGQGRILRPFFPSRASAGYILWICFVYFAVNRCLFIENMLYYKCAIIEFAVCIFIFRYKGSFVPTIGDTMQGVSSVEGTLFSA